MLDLIDKLITEHGSSTILKEHLSLFRSQVDALNLKYKNLETDNLQLKLDLEKSNAQLLVLQQENNQLKGGNTSGQFCAHCGSPDLKRAGSRPNPTFGDMGVIDHIFNCNACNKQSAFMQDI